MRDRGWIRPALWGGALLLLLTQAATYWPYFSDDALISLRYAQRLLEGQGLTWTDAPPRVEGYSNLLWLLLSAGLGGLGLDLIMAARLLGVACLAAVLAVFVGRAGGRQDSPAPWPALVPGLLLLALAAPAAAWSIGGLEHPLTALLLALALPPAFRLIEDDRPRAATALAVSLPLGLLCLTRPDGALFVAGMLAATVLGRRLGGRELRLPLLMLAALLPLLFSAGQLGFRLAYYGEWLPNTALVKLRPSLHHLLGGLKYVLHGGLALAPFSLAAGAWLVWASRRGNPRAILLLSLSALWLGYVALVGGDFFAAFRHFLPLLPLWAFALAEATRDLDPVLRGQWRLHRGRFLAWASTGLLLFLLLQRYDSGSRHAREELWEWQGREVALALKSAFAEERPLLAVTAAGCLPYWSELPCLDMLGLTDHHIAHHPPADFGQGPLAHELGDADYVWARQPDILCFHLGDREANFPSGQALQAKPDFAAHYVGATLQLERPSPFESVLWFRREGRAGLRREADRLWIPGHLLADAPGTKIRPLPGGLVAVLTPEQSAEVRVTGVDASWKVEVDPADRAVQAVLRDEGAWTRVVLSTRGPGEVLVRGLSLRPPDELSATR